MRNGSQSHHLRFRDEQQINTAKVYCGHCVRERVSYSQLGMGQTLYLSPLSQVDVGLWLLFMRVERDSRDVNYLNVNYLVLFVLQTNICCENRLSFLTQTFMWYCSVKNMFV